MELTLKHFKSDKRVDLCDEFDNVIDSKYYRDNHIDIGTVIRAHAYAQGFAEGWNRARQGRCITNPGMVEVEEMNARQWK